MQEEGFYSANISINQDSGVRISGQ